MSFPPDIITTYLLSVEVILTLVFFEKKIDTNQNFLDYVEI